MSEQASVVPIHGRMSATDYDASRAAIAAAYGSNRTEAGNRWEQELALLFHRSGWTHEQLADKEGKSRQWVTQRLLFGRYLASNSDNSDFATSGSQMSERAFRGYWEQTSQELTERQRFREITRMLVEGGQDQAEQKVLNPIKQAIREQFIDSKWHKPDTIANAIEADVEDVQKALKSMHARHSPRYKSERRGGLASYQYRFFPTGNPISYEELVEKLTPLIQQLRAQAKTNIATVSIPTFGAVAAELQRLLDEWGR